MIIAMTVMVQVFLKGRTEALRTVTAEVKTFLEAFCDPEVPMVSVSAFHGVTNLGFVSYGTRSPPPYVILSDVHVFFFLVRVCLALVSCLCISCLLCLACYFLCLALPCVALRCLALPSVVHPACLFPPLIAVCCFPLAFVFVVCTIL